MITVDKYCREQFGRKLYKLSFDGGFSCPNRDGHLGTGGCIFCSAGGSGDFAVKYDINFPKESLEKAKEKIRAKYKGEDFIAYFQAFSNTYGEVENLRSLYMSVINQPEIKVLSIATRPDCLSDNVYTLLRELNEIKPVWVELGLQTANESTAEYIRRGYKNEVYEEAVRKLNEIGIHTITHIILYLPTGALKAEALPDAGELKAKPPLDAGEYVHCTENMEDMLDTVTFAVKAGTKGIKIQVLQVLKGTDLQKEYEKSPFYIPSMEEYMETLGECLRLLPEDMVVHRLSGDPPRKLLIEPGWTLDKKRVLNAIKDMTEPSVPYFVYILRCEDGSLYTGITNDVKERFEKHLKGTGAKYTKAHRPVEIAYVEELKNKRFALQREIEIKKLSRKEKLELIEKR